MTTNSMVIIFLVGMAYTDTHIRLNWLWISSLKEKISDGVLAWYSNTFVSNLPLLYLSHRRLPLSSLLPPTTTALFRYCTNRYYCYFYCYYNYYYLIKGYCRCNLRYYQHYCYCCCYVYSITWTNIRRKKESFVIYWSLMYPMIPNIQ